MCKRTFDSYFIILFCKTILYLLVLLEEKPTLDSKNRAVVTNQVSLCMRKDFKACYLQVLLQIKPSLNSNYKLAIQIWFTLYM